MIRHCSFLCALFAVSLPALALAQDAGQLSYSAADGCPSREEFLEALAVRGVRLERPALSRFRIAIATDGTSFQGSLRVDGVEAASSARQVHAPNCADVVDALAVVTTIALRATEAQAEADVAHPTPAGSALDDPTPADGSPSAPDLSPRAAAGTSVASEREEGHLHASGDVMPPFERHHELQVPAGTLAFDRAVSITLSAGAALGVLPGKLVPRFDLIAERANFVTPPEGESLLVLPIVRGRLSFLGPSTRTTDGFATEVFGISTGIGTCWSPTYDNRGLSLLLCGEFGFGAMQVNTADESARQVQSKTMGYGSVGLSLEAQYSLGSLVHLQLALGGESTTQPVVAARADGTVILRAPSFGRSSSFSGYGINAHATFAIGIHF